ncbi:YwmB family TATA-box binding protein [Paenibacillus lupini]
MSTNRFARKTADQAASQRARLGIIIAAVVLLSGVIWAAVNKDQIRNQKNDSVLAHDIALLWQWTDKLYNKGAANTVWTLRWDIEGEGAVLEQTGQKLQADEIGQEQGTLSIFPLSSENQAMIVYVTKQGTAKKQLLAIVNMVETDLKESGLTYSGGMTVRGDTEYNNAAERLAHAASGKRIDRYKDNSGTVSEAYYSEKLFSAVEAGAGKKANLQIAAHRETESKQLSLIIGIPLITGDYTVSQQGID